MRMILCNLAVVLLIASQGMAQYSARESFVYQAGKSIDTLGTAVDGWASPWLIDTSASHNYNLAAVADTGFDYTDLYTTSIPYVGKHLTAGSVGRNWSINARYRRSLDKTWPNAHGQYWVSLLLDTKGTYSGNTYFMVKLYNSAGEVVAIGKGGGGTTYSCGSGWPGGSGADVSATQEQAGPVWLVAMFNIATAGEATTRTFMWINPDPSTTPDTNSADVKRYTALGTGIIGAGIEFGGADTMELSFDEIRLGTSFADVSSAITRVLQNSHMTPAEFALSQNYPNPFNPTTKMEYSVSRSSFVTLKMYNILGQEVATLFSGMQNAGSYVAAFDGTRFASGVYFYRLQAGNVAITKNMVLMK